MPITPAVGRKVYYFADGSAAEPTDATIVKVLENGNVNLRVTDGNTGVTSFVTDVPCKQEGDTYSHYRWMEYQLKQVETAAPAPAPSRPL